jgi:hypothetical protein
MASGGVKRQPFLLKVRRRTNIVLGLTASLFAATLAFYFFSAWDNLATLNIVVWHLLHPLVLPVIMWGIFMASQRVMLAATALSAMLFLVEFVYIIIRFIDWFDCEDVPACDVNFGPFIVSTFIAVVMAIHLASIAYFSFGLRSLFRCSIPRDNGVRLCAADMVGSPLLKGEEDDALDMAEHFGNAYDSMSGHYSRNSGMMPSIGGKVGGMQTGFAIPV